MATRGWTLGAASSDPHDFPGTVHGDPADLGEEAELLILRSWQRHHRSWRPTRWTCWLTRNSAFTRARDGYLIHRTLARNDATDLQSP